MGDGGQSKYGGMIRTDDSEDEGYLVGFARVTYTTERAIKVDLGDDTADWIPRSQLHINNEVEETGDEGELWVSSWMARQRGWI